MSSIVIEQDKSQAQLAFRLHTRADIASVRMMESAFACKVRLEDVKFPLLPALKHEAENAVVAGRKLTIPIKFGFRAVSEDKESEVIVVACRLEVEYDLDEGYVPSWEEIEAFRQGNAIFNCWAYFREYVQSTVARMNYPPITLPFLRMIPRIAAQKDSPVAPEAVEGTVLIEQSTQGPERKRKTRKKKETEESR
jgi:hypothetical protein